MIASLQTPDAPILGQVALSYCPIVDAQRNVMATRLTVFPLGTARWLPVGELRALLDVPGATLTSHLNILRQAGLVTDEREGRVIRLRADYGRMDALLAYLTENCCAGTAACGPATTSAQRRTATCP